MKRYRSAFCTVNEVIRQIEISQNTDNDLATTIDTLIATKYANVLDRLKRLIYEVSREIEAETDNTFIAYLRTANYYRKYVYNNFHRLEGERWLELDDSLISISSLTWDSSLLDSTLYRLQDPNTNPNTAISFDYDASLTALDNFTDSVDIVGVWGYHEDPDNMWLDSGDTVQDNPLSSSATTLNVNDGDNFEVLQYIRIESEYLLITAINTNALTVQRGVRGTSAAAHIQTTQIDTFLADDRATQSTRRIVIQRWLNPGETRRFAPLPDGTIQIDGNDIEYPPHRMKWFSA